MSISAPARARSAPPARPPSPTWAPSWRDHVAVPRRRSHAALSARHRTRRALPQVEQHLRLYPDEEVEADPPRTTIESSKSICRARTLHRRAAHARTGAAISQAQGRGRAPANGFPDEIRPRSSAAAPTRPTRNRPRHRRRRQAHAHGIKAPCRSWSRRAPTRSTTIQRDGQLPRCSRSAAPSSPTPAARASASGAEDEDGAAEHHRHLVQPQFPAAQRRPAETWPSSPAPRSSPRWRWQVGCLQSAHRHTDRRRRQAIRLTRRSAPELPAPASLAGSPATSAAGRRQRRSR